MRGACVVFDGCENVLFCHWVLYLLRESVSSSSSSGPLFVWMICVSSLCVGVVLMFPVMMAWSRFRVIDAIHHRCSQSPLSAGGAKLV